MNTSRIVALIVLPFVAWPAPVASEKASAWNAPTKVELTITTDSQDRPVPCRVHLMNDKKKAMRAENLPFWRDHFVCPGTAHLELSAGRYTYEIERGPEYGVSTGSFTVAEGLGRRVEVKLRRLVDLAAEGWWPGELHVHRPLQDIELLMQAEDLHVAPAITWWNNQNVWEKEPSPEKLLVRFDGNRYYHAMGGEDEREGGALLFFHLPRPLAIAGASREYPSPMKFVSQARQHKNVWIDIEKPFWWDVPVWLASGQVDSIGIANNHMCRSQMYETEAWGKPRDTDKLPPPLGNGFWTQEIYYHILNCGLRIPPSAGSASGVLPNPVGYNRVYVYLGDKLDHDAWWEGLRAGRSFVTNGPLLRVSANGHLPGHVFSAPAGEALKLDLSMKLTSRDPISAVEIIKNGRVEHRTTFDDWSKTGSLGSLTFTESGWFLVRALADNAKTFRFASTAPFYVEIGSVKNRISKSSCQFFLNWVNERAVRVKLDDPVQRREVLVYHEHAKEFWTERAAGANAP